MIMIIKLSQFGRVLTSRDDGGEALLSYLPRIESLDVDEDIVIDFNGVLAFSSGWGDAFITPLVKKYGQRLKLMKSENLSVVVTLEVLNEQHGYHLSFA